MWRDRVGVFAGSGGCACGASCAFAQAVASAAAVRHLPYPELELPFQINGGQYAPVAWSGDRGLERGRSSRRLQGVSHQLQADSGAANAAGGSEGARHLAARSLPGRERPRTVRRAEGKSFLRGAFSSRCAFRGLAKARALSPAITSPSSTARGRRTRSTRCRSIAGRPTCSSAAPRRARPACPTRARCFARSAAASWCPITTAARSRMASIAGRGLEICYLKEQTDLLFSQIQGSARVSLDDGSTVRINYDAHNGYPYTAVGRILIERNIIPKDQMSMQKIREWMEAESQRGRRAAAAEQVLRLLPRGAAFRQGRGGRRPGRAADAGPLDRGRQIAACLWHAVLHRRRTADRNGAHRRRRSAG